MDKGILMQTTLQSNDFIKVRKFIDTNSKKLVDNAPLVKELSSTNLYIGKCHIVKNEDNWDIFYYDETITFFNKRNAMYYAYMIAYNKQKVIPALISLDGRIRITQTDIVRYKYLLSEAYKIDDQFKIGLYHNKLSEAVARYKRAKIEMHDWMNRAKYINS